MRRLLLLCAFVFLAGCGAKNGSQALVNGQCGTVQDACRFGTPSGTGDTSAPYAWVCLGRGGGVNDTCSVPTAPVDPGEKFAGQNELAEKVKAAGPMRGLVTLFDGSYDDPACRPNCHGNHMKKYIEEMGIPEENINVDTTDRHLFDPALIGNTLVAILPTGFVWHNANRESTESLQKSNLLVVSAAGNTEQDPRDLWYPDNPHWTEFSWEKSMAFVETGKVIFAKHAERPLPNGTIVPYKGNVKCGTVMDYCYSILLPDRQNTGTSGASANLGALTFYLFQLWDTPREVIGVLNACAEDVGEPGIDEEFGRGIVSVVCDTVQNRERTVAASSVGSPGAASSPVLDQMIGDSAALRPRPQSLMPLPLPASGRFRPFYAVRLYDLETVSGYLGGEFSLKGTGFLVSGGADYAPLGVRSSLLYAARTPFMEFGGRRGLFSRGGHRFSLLGSYGRSGGDGLLLNVGRLGGQYRYRFTPSSVLSLYGGHRLAYGFLGIPGYRQAGAEPVSFVDHVPEARVSLAVRW